MKDKIDLFEVCGGFTLVCVGLLALSISVCFIIKLFV